MKNHEQLEVLYLKWFQDKPNGSFSAASSGSIPQNHISLDDKHIFGKAFFHMILVFWKIQMLWENNLPCFMEKVPPFYQWEELGALPRKPQKLVEKIAGEFLQLEYI